MPTSLTNSKMSPELAARVESAVTGKRLSARERASSARIVAVVRALVIVVIGGVVASIVIARRQSARELEAMRQRILDDVHQKGGGVTEADRAATSRDEAWLLKSSGAYEGERAYGDLTELFARPAVYVRGSTDAFTTSNGVARAIKSSTKDSLLACLITPPTARTEKALMERVRVVYDGGAAFEKQTANVRELAEADAALRVLSPEWEQSVRRADDLLELSRRKTEFERAPLDLGIQALRASTLIIAMDETSNSTGPSELDGERPHDVRLVVIDLIASKVLLSARKRVDPSVWSPTVRANYASGIDGCAFAFDLRKP